MEKDIKIRLMSGLAALVMSSSLALVKTENALADETVKPAIVVDFNEEDYSYDTYKVKKGDTLSKISEKVCTRLGAKADSGYWPVLAYLNGYPRTINPGNILVYPDNMVDVIELYNELDESGWIERYTKENKIYGGKKKKDEERTAVGIVVEPQYINRLTFDTYTVVEGDNLSHVSEKISHQYGVPVTTKYWPVIAYLNDYPRVARPGDVLIYPETLEQTERLYDRLESSGWIANYKYENNVYGTRRHRLTVGQLLDDIYGDGFSDCDPLVRRYMHLHGLDPDKYDEDHVIRGDDLYLLTEWIPDIEEVVGCPPKHKVRKHH